MADIHDVCSALVTLITNTIYPNGSANPSVVSGAVPCKVFEGWPLPQQLDIDLAQSNPIANISIFPLPTERNTTRYPKDWQQKSVSATTLTATVSGQTITIGGTVTTPQNVAALVNGLPFVYAVQANDTLTTIATGLKNLINASVAGTTSIGAVITVPNGKKIQTARVGTSGQGIREIKRQERLFQITVWASTPDARTAIANLLDPVLSDASWLTLADGTSGRLTYKGSPMTDGFEKSRVYRRDFQYSVEYATTQTETEYMIIALQENVSNQPDGATSVISSTQINY